MVRSPVRFPGLALLLVCLPSAFAQSDWPMFGGNPQHTGQNTAETGIPPLTVAWSVTLANNKPLSPAVVENGMLFVTQQDDMSPSTCLWARSAADGTPVWTYDFGPQEQVGDPSVSDGAVYVQNVDWSLGGLLHRFDAATGTVAWSAPFFAQWDRFWAPTIANGTVFAGAERGVYGFTPAGVQLFSTRLDQDDEWTPAYDDGTLYTFTGPDFYWLYGNLRAEDASTGQILWTMQVNWNWSSWDSVYGVHSVPVVSNGLIYLAAAPVLYAVDPATQSVVWRADGYNFSGTPAVANDMVYAISDGTLQARGAATGALLWSFSGDRQLFYPPVVGNGGFVYVSSPSNTYAVDPVTGVQVWTTDAGGWLSIADGRLFIAGPTGVLSAFAMTPSAALPPPTVPPPYQPPSLPPPQPSPSNWAMFGGDSQHTGLNAGETLAPPLARAWSANIGRGRLSPAVVQDGRVFVSGAEPSRGGLSPWDEYRLWSRLAADGTSAWSYSFGEVNSVGHPSVVGGRVYIQACNQTPMTQLYCIDAWQGTRLWSSALAAQWEDYWAPTVAGNNVYINGGLYGGMYGFSTSGTPLFFTPLDQYDSWSPAVDGGSLYTYVGWRLRTHDPASGTVLSTANLPWVSRAGSMNTAPVVGNGRIYVITDPDLHAVNPNTGAIVWSTNGAECSGTPAYANGVVYAISADMLQARDAATGTWLWTSACDSSLKYPPVVANGYVYAASADDVYVVDAATGEQVWIAAGGGWVSLAGGRLFVAAPTGSLTAYVNSADVSPPTPPTSGVPESGALVTASPVSLAWSGAADDSAIVGYEVQVARDPGFLNLYYSITRTSTSLTLSLLWDGTHYWRVRVRDDAGAVSAWSPVWTFTVDTRPPGYPVLVSPPGGAPVGTSEVALSWNAAFDSGSGVREYDVQVAQEYLFAEVEWSATVPSLGVTTGALGDGPHFWRVRARDNAGRVSIWGSLRSFWIDTAPPGGTSATGPADGTDVASGTPLLTWSTVSDPGWLTYEVEVAGANPIAAPLEAWIRGLTTTQWSPPPLLDGTHYWHVRAVDNVGNAGPWSATMSFVVNTQKGFYVGLGIGGRGQIAPFQRGSDSYAARPLYAFPWTAYDSAVGETRPAAIDLYRDGRAHVVVGLGRYPRSGGWLLILSDTGSGFTVLRWIRLGWSEYNAANGETWPACGDIDGDGRDEIVVGLGRYTPDGGRFALYDDASTGFAFLGWKQVPWPQYNAFDGQTRPAVGDLDGDGASEVLIGLGPYPGQGGYVYTFTSSAVTSSGRLRVNWTTYNAANGETWPACGDVDGDGRDEVCLGLGAFPRSGGWMQYFDDSTTGFASLRWLRVNWAGYNAASGETRPSLGHLTGPAADQTVVGFGANAGANGWVAIYDRAPGFGLLGWRRVNDLAYDASNGSTRPSAGR